MVHTVTWMPRHDSITNSTHVNVNKNSLNPSLDCGYAGLLSLTLHGTYWTEKGTLGDSCILGDDVKYLVRTTQRSIICLVALLSFSENAVFFSVSRQRTLKTTLYYYYYYISIIIRRYSSNFKYFICAQLINSLH